MSATPPNTAATTRLVPLELLAAAEQATGLADYGDMDPRPSLAALCHSINEEATLTEAGMAGKRLSLIRVLCNRLLLQNELARNPAVLRQTIVKPIVILGLPRSGTTKLHRLIAADPGMQKLPLWKLLFPVKALTPGAGSDVERRIAATEGFVNAIKTGNPEMYAGHPMLAREPDEEYFGMELSFQAHINTSSFYTPSYERWLDEQDFTNWYAWLRQFLQYQQFVDGGVPRPWVLKAPHHLGHLPLLFQFFPDATVVHCHRDPVTTVTSFCALIGASRRNSSCQYRSEEVGRYILRVYRKRMQAYLRDRAHFEKTKAFVDLDYRRILNDSPQVVRECYAAAKIDLTLDAESAMRHWETANEQHKHGRHQYSSLASYGISEADIHEAFGEYCRQFKPYLT
jgi:hypothetical protein